MIFFTPVLTDDLSLKSDGQVISGLQDSFKVLQFISTVLWAGYSRFFLWSPVFPVSFPDLYGPFQMFSLRYVSSPPSCPSFFNSIVRSKYLYFIFTLWSAGTAKSIKAFLLGGAWFYSISTIVDYLMPNSLYTNILNTYMGCKNIL